jgi:hypothetical protein
MTWKPPPVLPPRRGGHGASSLSPHGSPASAPSPTASTSPSHGRQPRPNPPAIIARPQDEGVLKHITRRFEPGHLHYESPPANNTGEGNPIQYIHHGWLRQTRVLRSDQPLPPLPAPTSPPPRQPTPLSPLQVQLQQAKASHHAWLAATFAQQHGPPAHSIAPPTCPSPDLSAGSYAQEPRHHTFVPSPSPEFYGHATLAPHKEPGPTWAPDYGATTRFTQRESKMQNRFWPASPPAPAKDMTKHTRTFSPPPPINESAAMRRTAQLAASASSPTLVIP